MCQQAIMSVSRKRWEYVRYGEEGVKKHGHDAAHVGTKTSTVAGWWRDCCWDVVFLDFDR